MFKKKTGNSLTADVGKMYVHIHTSESSYLRSGQVEDQSIMVMELWATETPLECFTWKFYIFHGGLAGYKRDT